MIAQICAVLIFVVMFALIIAEKFERHTITLCSALLTLLVVFGGCMQDVDAIIDTINVHTIFRLDFWYHTGTTVETSSGINWETIIFITGMMIMVEGMARVGFFRWLCMRIANIVHYKTIPIFITFMLMSAILAMFIDIITVIFSGCNGRIGTIIEV